MNNSHLINLDVEQGIIGAVLANHLALNALPRELSAEHFAHPAHQRIWQAIRGVTGAGDVVNAALLRHRFENCPDLISVGGGKYLQDLALASIVVIKIDYYARVLMNLAARRQLVALAAEVSDRASTLEDVQACEVAAGGVRQLQAIINQTMQNTMFDGNALMNMLSDDYKRQVKPVSTGLSRLDKSMGGGLVSGFMYGIGGRKKIGKTMLVATISTSLARQKVKHLVVCAEMHPKEVFMRMLGSMVGCGTSAFRDGSAFSSPDLRDAIIDASKEISEYCLFVAEPGISFEKLREVVACAQATKGIQGYILDYWQLVGGREGRKGLVEHLDEVAQWIADFGRKNNLWSIVMSQLNQEDNTRGGEGLRLACDQLYFLKPCGDNGGDINIPARWLQMAESRYTQWMDIGGEQNPYLELVNGTHFKELPSKLTLKDFAPE